MSFEALVFVGVHDFDMPPALHALFPNKLLWSLY